MSDSSCQVSLRVTRLLTGGEPYQTPGDVQVKVISLRARNRRRTRATKWCVLHHKGSTHPLRRSRTYWLIALLDGKLISQASLEELWAPTKLSNGKTVDMYGLGWWLAPPPHPAVGGNGGGRSSFFVYRKDGLAVIVLTNLIGSDAPSLVDAVAKKYWAS